MIYSLPPIFDTSLLLEELKQYKKPHDKITKLILSNDIVRIRPGLYVLGQKYNKPHHPFLLANLIFGTPCVTSYSALAYWGTIPERVETVISFTLKRNKAYLTPLGKYEYKHLNKNAYSKGIVYNNFLIASKEKALIDLISVNRALTSIKKIESFLMGLRIEEDFFSNPQIDVYQNIGVQYNSRSVKYFLAYLEKTNVK